ncbi:hypothetical protein [Rothia dentocariosa]|uniref:hypothetical protein n=1 Tax=Rothia dentocariosa TaxID=2047 RepID=UPI002449F4D4|nr:hypothetical protein [Rothia dentocariosa]
MKSPFLAVRVLSKPSGCVIQQCILWITKGASVINTGSGDDPHRLTVTPFEQLLQDAHDG